MPPAQVDVPPARARQSQPADRAGSLMHDGWNVGVGSSNPGVPGPSDGSNGTGVFEHGTPSMAISISCRTPICVSGDSP